MMNRYSSQIIFVCIIGMGALILGVLLFFTKPTKPDISIGPSTIPMVEGKKKPNTFDLEHARINEIPLIDLLSPENLKKEQMQEEVLYHPQKISPEPEHPKDSQLILRPEDRGENYDNFSLATLLLKLNSGEKIEQRKAANELWKRYGKEGKKLNPEDYKVLDDCVLKYLRMSGSDFEEGFLQLHRLWWLAVPGLMKNVTNDDNKISELSARMLSLMKNESIIDDLVRLRDKAQNDQEKRKINFALKYMEINNPAIIDRPQISEEEAIKLYKKIGL